MRIVKLLQKHLEAFEAEYNAADDVRGVSRGAGQVVRAAIAAGWFGPDCDADVGEMAPKEVRQLAAAINEAYREATTLDPN